MSRACHMRDLICRGPRVRYACMMGAGLLPFLPPLSSRTVSSAPSNSSRLSSVTACWRCHWRSISVEGLSILLLFCRLPCGEALGRSQMIESSQLLPKFSTAVAFDSVRSPPLHVFIPDITSSWAAGLGRDLQIYHLQVSGACNTY